MSRPPYGYSTCVTHTDKANRLARAAQESGATVAVAESLTSGALASALGAAPDAAAWFRGGVVAYSSEVKHDLLDVPPGPVVSRQAVEAMAERTADLLGATVAVAVSGVGGPEREDGQPVGTVWFAVRRDADSTAGSQQFGGDPEEVVEQTVDHALGLLLEALDEA